MKIKSLSIITMISLCMFGCNMKSNKPEIKDESDNAILVTYFSASGVTREAAINLGKATQADLEEIRPEQPYSEADLDWRNDQSRSIVEMRDDSARPAFEEMDVEMNDYNTIYIGFPIWCNTYPKIIATFIESNNLKGKTLIPFATSGSSGIEAACEDLKKAYPDLNWKPGILLNGKSKEEIAQMFGKSK